MKAESQIIPLLIIFVAAFIGALAQYFFKEGSLKIVELPIYQNTFFLAGLFSFSLVLVLMTLSFRLGGLMLVIYPAYGTTYIWGMLISRYIDKTPVNFYQISGIFLIIAGIALVAYRNE